MTDRRRSTRAGTILACIIVAVAALVLTAPNGQAATTDSRSAVKVSIGKKGSGLRVRGVRVRAIRPARLRGSRLTLRAVDIDFSGARKASLVLSGGIRLSRGRRQMRISGALLTIRRDRIRITAKLDRKRVVLFTGDARKKATYDAGERVLKVRSSSLKLTRSGARAINRKLRLRSRARIKAATVGRISVAAQVAPPQPIVPAPINPAGPTLGEISDEPTLLARPASAVNVTGAPLVWHIRDSWRRYVAGGLYPSGVVAGSPISGNDHVCKDSPDSAIWIYDYSLPFVSGWYDAASSTASLSYSGGLQFEMLEHNINFMAKDAIVEIHGGSSRVIFTMVTPDHPGGRRAVLTDLNVASPLNAVAPTPNAGMSRLKSNLASGNATSLFAGFYAPGAGFGCFDVTYGS